MGLVTRFSPSHIAQFWRDWTAMLGYRSADQNGGYRAPAAKSQVTFRDEVGRLRAPIAIGSVCALALAALSRAARYRDKLAAEAPDVTDRGTTRVTVHGGRRLMRPGGSARPGQGLDGPHRRSCSLVRRTSSRHERAWRAHTGGPGSPGQSAFSMGTGSNDEGLSLRLMIIAL
jgi:hypothetical protein